MRLRNENKSITYFLQQAKSEKKLLFSYVILIVIPLIILGLYSYYNFSNALFEKVIVSSQENNAQIVKNIDDFLTGLLKISEFPGLDGTISNILKKDYRESENRLVEILKDTESANWTGI